MLDRTLLLLAALASLLLALPARAQSPLSTAFTYQGRLEVENALANGSYDLRFRLFTSATAGVQIGGTLCVDNVEVENGLFSVSLDFGGVYNGDRRYLEIQVRPGAVGDCAVSSGYSALNPRQELTVTPHAALAVQAVNASALDGLPSTSFPKLSATNTFVANNFFNGGFTGVGVASPVTGADVFAVGKNESAGAYVGMYVRAANASSRPFYGYAAAGTYRWWTYLSGGDNSWRLNNNTGDVLTVTSAGNLGLGTLVPLDRLDVRGNIRFGASGDLFAAGSPTIPLTVLAGRIIGGSGSVVFGYGFSCNRIQTGYYRLTFPAPFARAPIVTATSIGSPRTMVISGLSTATVDIVAYNQAGAVTDTDFCFTVIGER